MTVNRRTQTRHVVSIPAVLSVGGESIQTTILNLSLGGAQLGGSTLTMGQRVTLEFNIPGLEAPISTAGTVRWTSAGETGIQFEGLRALEVWALGKLFEQA